MTARAEVLGRSRSFYDLIVEQGVPPSKRNDDRIRQLVRLPAFPSAHQNDRSRTPPLFPTSCHQAAEALERTKMLRAKGDAASLAELGEEPGRGGSSPPRSPSVASEYSGSHGGHSGGPAPVAPASKLSSPVFRPPTMRMTGSGQQSPIGIAAALSSPGFSPSAFLRPTAPAHLQHQQQLQQHYQQLQQQRLAAGSAAPGAVLANIPPGAQAQMHAGAAAATAASRLRPKKPRVGGGSAHVNSRPNHHHRVRSSAHPSALPSSSGSPTFPCPWRCPASARCGGPSSADIYGRGTT